MTTTYGSMNNRTVGIDKLYLMKATGAVPSQHEERRKQHQALEKGQYREQNTGTNSTKSKRYD